VLHIWWAKNDTMLYAITSSNINRFSTLFHHQNHEKICNNTVITKDLIPPRLKCEVKAYKYGATLWPTLYNVNVNRTVMHANTLVVYYSRPQIHLTDVYKLHRLTDR